MGWNDHLLEPEEYEMTCPHCGKKFGYYETEQTPGFRMKEYLYCPYCDKEIESSMEYEWTVFKK